MAQVNNQVTTATQTTIANLYISILGRNPEPAGFGFWCDRLADNGNTTAAAANIARGFANSPEFIATYGGQTTSQAMTLMYNNVLNRAPDAGGLAFWVAQANALIANGNSVADAYALTGAAIITTAGTNSSSDTALIVAKQTAAISSGTSAPTTTYTLTTGINDLDVGPNALVEGTETTFQLVDSISGSGANNTLSLIDSGTAAWTLPAASVSGMQTVSMRNINGVAATPAVSQVSTITYAAITNDAEASVITLENVADDPVEVDIDTLTGTTSGADVAIAVAAAVNAAAGALYVASVVGNSVVLTAIDAGVIEDAATSAVALGADSTGGAAVVLVTTTGADAVAAGGAVDTLDADNFIGTTTFISDRSTSAVTINDVNAGTQITMNGASSTVGNGALTAVFDAGVSTITFNATNGTGTTATRGAVGLTSAAVSDLTTVNINSTGGTNRVGAITLNGSATTVNVNATTAVDITSIAVGTNVAAQAIVVSGAAANRGATATAAPTAAVVLGTLDSDIDSVNASGLTAGGVSLTINDTAATITGGAGADFITTAAGAQLGAVTAGSGTDVLIQANTNAIATLTAGNLFSGFEIYQANNGVALDMDLIATNNTIGAIRLNDAAGTTAITDMTATQAANITVLAANGAATLALKTATGTSDVMNILISDLDLTGAENITTAVDWTIANVETINITAFDDLTMAATNNITGVNSIVVAGGGDVSITTGAMSAASGMAFDYTGITATAATLNFAAALAQPITFLGSAGADTVTDSVIGGNVITTNAGQDVITLTLKTGGTGGNTITGGAGGDTIDINGAEGNSAIQRITFKYANGDSVITSSVVGTGYDSGVMDRVINVDLATAAAAGAGNVLTFDTAQSATAVTFSATAVTFGTTAVTNAFDFYVYNTAAGGISYIYQDTDGDRIIENGEFGVQIVGITTTATTSGEFAVTTGNLVLTTV